MQVRNNLNGTIKPLKVQIFLRKKLAQFINVTNHTNYILIEDVTQLGFAEQKLSLFFDNSNHLDYNNHRGKKSAR